MARISEAAEHGGNQQRPMVRVNDGPRKLDHSERHLIFDEEWFAEDIMKRVASSVSLSSDSLPSSSFRFVLSLAHSYLKSLILSVCSSPLSYHMPPSGS